MLIPCFTCVKLECGFNRVRTFISTYKSVITQRIAYRHILNMTVLLAMYCNFRERLIARVRISSCVYNEYICEEV